MVTAESIMALASCYHTEITIAAFLLCFVHYFCQRNGHPFNWPLIGMLPTWFPLTLPFCDHLTNIIQLCHGTFVFKGPWFANRDMITTVDPRNVQHILSKNMSNYPKGPDTRKIFEAYGEILFTSDHDIWRKERKLIHKFFRDRRLHNFNVQINQEIIEKALIPILDLASEDGFTIDLQDLSQRYMLDATCMMTTGHNPGYLRVGFPEEAVLSALHNAGEAIFFRHILPESLWKLQILLGFGVEYGLRKAHKILDDAAEKCIKTWKERKLTRKSESEYRDHDHEPFSAINYLIYEEKEFRESIGLAPENIMRDVIKGLIVAGTDTASPVLPWFFWLLSKNPCIELKIRKELESNINLITSSTTTKRTFFDPEELNNLIYLHAALCETLRLFPPAPFLPRTCIQPDILPSGHHAKANVRIALCIYAMGRMKSIWGEDCREFKPERWISERGRLKPVASEKFVAFSTGPRICMGKDMAFIRLKAVAATILHNYQIQIIKNQQAGVPATSIFLRMKHGLLAKVIRRSTSSSN